MNIKKSYRAITLFLLFLSLSQGCIFKTQKADRKEQVQTPEFVIYCENGVLAPVLEIIDQFRTTHDVNIRIQNDCSQNLISLLQYTRDADIFIPDTRNAIEKLKNIQPGIFLDTVFLGYNPMVFMVPKGNPLKFDGTFESLSNPRFSIILANPETSSLGYETQKMLQSRRLFDPVMRETMVALSVDSRGLLKSVATGQASVAIDWLSSYKQNSNHLLVDTISLPANHHSPKIYAATLSASANPLLARAFLITLKSDFGATIFQKYGIYKRPTFVF